jgi:hypothetical protein
MIVSRVLLAGMMAVAAALVVAPEPAVAGGACAG